MSNKQEIILKGVVVSEGIAIGKPLMLQPQEKEIPDFSLGNEEVELEVDRYRLALRKSCVDIEHLQKNYDTEESSVVSGILTSHLEMLNDPMVTTDIEDRIRKTKKNSEAVFVSAMTEYKDRFKQIKDVFFLERIKDVEDVSNRVLKHLVPTKVRSDTQVPNDSIAICMELVPSDTYETTYSHVIGFISQRGGLASHAAIIARARGIPYVSKIDVTVFAQPGIDQLVVDGQQGLVIINPTQKTIERYLQAQKQLAKDLKVLQETTNKPLVTKEGTRVKMYGNIDNMDDISLLKASHGDGIGLFRSEYLFLMERKFPSEEKQFQIYREVAKQMDALPAIIRLFDIGNDKNYTFTSWEDFSQMHYELNPALGFRAVRYLLNNPVILKSQIRALLRASRFGNLHLLIPFITNIEEIRAIKRIIEECRQELISEHYHVPEFLPIGCMIEVPSAALQSHILIKEVDFFSIGTNDLTQYVLAVDRTNPLSSSLYQSAHPAVLALIKNACDAAISEKKRVIVCGEMTLNPKYLCLLIGLGISEFSVSVRKMPKLKQMIRDVDDRQARSLATQALACSSANEVDALVL